MAQRHKRKLEPVDGIVSCGRRQGWQKTYQRGSIQNQRGRTNGVRLCGKDESRGLKVLDELELRARLWAVRVSLAFFDSLPEGGDDPQRFLAALGIRRLDEPTPDDHARPSNATAAMHRAHTTPPFVVPQDVQDGEHELCRLGQGAVLDGELVVLDVGERDAVCVCEVGEVGGVWGEFTGFGEVDEGADTCGEEFVEFLGGGLEWGPGVFAGEEVGGCPVGVGDGTWAGGVEGRKGGATLGATLAGVDGDGGDVEGVGHLSG